MANLVTVNEGCRVYGLDTTATGANGIMLGDVAEGQPSTVFLHVKELAAYKAGFTALKNIFLSAAPAKVEEAPVQEETTSSESPEAPDETPL